MQVKSIAECSKAEHYAILLTFIKQPIVIKIFVLSIFEWSFYTGLTVFLFLVFAVDRLGMSSLQEYPWWARLNGKYPLDSSTANCHSILYVVSCARPFEMSL